MVPLLVLQERRTERVDGMEEVEREVGRGYSERVFEEAVREFLWKLGMSQYD